MSETPAGKCSYMNETVTERTLDQLRAKAQPQKTKEEKKFPEIQGGGSLILAWQIRNKRVLVVGGGEVCTYHHKSDQGL